MKNIGGWMKGEYYLDLMYITFNGKEFIRTDTSEVIDGKISLCYNNSESTVIQKDSGSLKVMRPMYKITPR